MRRFGSASLVLVALALAASPTARAGPVVPSPAPSAMRTSDPATRVHLGIVSCDGAPFYSWPDRSTIPLGSTYPPARTGEAIHVIGDGTLSTNGGTFYETTIDVVEPFGIGKHYYISARCINAG